jgi:hypothetical protein
VGNFVLAFDILYVQSANRYTSSSCDQMFTLGSADVFGHLSGIRPTITGPAAKISAFQDSPYASKIFIHHYLPLPSCSQSQSMYCLHLWKVKFYFMYTYTV